VTFDPLLPYGEVLGSTCRLVSWNVWGRFADWQTRQRSLERVLAGLGPDVVCLQESWEDDHTRQADLIGDHLGLDHRLAHADWPQADWRSGVAIISRWPVGRHERRQLPAPGAAPGTALFAELDGPRGPLQVFTAILHYPLHASGARQAQVAELTAFVAEVQRRRHPTIVCGDFNADADSDEIRMMTGRRPPPVEGLVFYDAWETAGDGGPGRTWVNANPLAAVSLLPDRRMDYIFSAWPRPGGAGHPVHCEVIGNAANDGDNNDLDNPVSDHYGLCADLRY
jgi:endonuclease/exonuclease/phosphatase family metal-dependent hydrolase